MGYGFGGKAALPARLERARGEYGGWLARQPLSANTRRDYATRVGLFLGYLASAPPEGYGDPLADPHARDYAARGPVPPRSPLASNLRRGRDPLANRSETRPDRARSWASGVVF